MKKHQRTHSERERDRLSHRNVGFWQQLCNVEKNLRTELGGKKSENESDNLCENSLVFDDGNDKIKGLKVAVGFRWQMVFWVFDFFPLTLSLSRTLSEFSK